MTAISTSKLTVVGAGYVGATCAHLAALKNLAPEICLIDIAEGRPQGIALDMNQSAAIEGFSSRIVGTNDPRDTYDTDVFIVTAGLPRKPGMSRSDLLEVNGNVMKSVAEYIRAGSPEAIVIVVTNPLDSMVTLMRHSLGFPARRVIGMAGVLDSARYSWFLAEATGTAVQDIDAMVLGAHGDSMVPMAERCTASGIGVLDLLDRDAIEAMGERTKKGGGEIVKLLKTGSAWYAPASGAVAMAGSILLDQKRLLPCACLLNGEFGIENLYMGVPAVLGTQGVERIVELPLRTESRALLQKTAGAIHEDVLAMRDLGLL